MPPPRASNYDAEAHANRIRELLFRYIDMLPLKALVKLQEVAALLEAGERLDVRVNRERLGKRGGKVQVQKRDNVDRGQRTSLAQAVEDAAAHENERDAGSSNLPAGSSASTRAE